MAKILTLMSTGIDALDSLIQNVMPGDNVAWNVDSIRDYVSFVHPFCRKAFKSGNRVVYFRFADHI